MEAFIRSVDQWVWGPPMLAAFLMIGLFYSVKLRFFPIRYVRIWWKETAGSLLRKKGTSLPSDGLSSFQALSMALGGAIGTGNIVGVAGALALGGPGALLWMWVAAGLGMSTIMAETVLGCRFRRKVRGQFAGGPMYYLEDGLGFRPGAIVFAVCCVLASLGMGNLTQVNSAAQALWIGFGIPFSVSGVVLAVVTGLIVCGGIRQIAFLAEKAIPLMAIAFTVVCIAVIAVNFRNIPGAFRAIAAGAFGWQPAAGGFAGYGLSRAVKYGVSRGVFSNEAGLGSAPMVYSCSQDGEEPFRAAFWGIFQVFLDTIVLCTLMALAILTSGCDYTLENGVDVCSQAFSGCFGEGGRVLICSAIVLFSFATVISWCYYGEAGWGYLFGEKTSPLPFRLVYAAAVYIGCTMSCSLVWEASDAINGLMAVPNLIALVFLSRQVRYSDLKKLLPERRPHLD